MKKAPKAPQYLSKLAANLFDDVLERFDLESHDLVILIGACECLDRANEARLLLARDGLTFRDRHGHIRPNPAVNIERDSKGLLARLLRELGLNVEEESDGIRPPLITGRRKFGEN